MNAMVKHYFEKCVEEAILSSEFYSGLVFNPECPWPLETVCKGVRAYISGHPDGFEPYDETIAILSDQSESFVRIDGQLVGFYTLCEHIAEKITED